MTSESAGPFDWLTPLGASVALFVLFGVLNVFVGVVAPIFTGFRGPAEASTGGLFFSERSDTIVFGTAPAQLLREDRPLATLRWLMLLWLAAMLLAFGILQLALAWFGLRERHLWALWALSIGDLATLPYWLAMIQAYVRHGAPLGVGDLPPLFLYLAAIPIAALLGWVGLRQ
jgi:hypothetical protein